MYTLHIYIYLEVVCRCVIHCEYALCPKWGMCITCACVDMRFCILCLYIICANEVVCQHTMHT